MAHCEGCSLEPAGVLVWDAAGSGAKQALCVRCDALARAEGGACAAGGTLRFRLVAAGAPAGGGVPDGEAVAPHAGGNGGSQAATEVFSAEEMLSMLGEPALPTAGIEEADTSAHDLVLAARAASPLPPEAAAAPAPHRSTQGAGAVEFGPRSFVEFGPRSFVSIGGAEPGVNMAVYRPWYTAGTSACESETSEDELESEVQGTEEKTSLDQPTAQSAGFAGTDVDETVAEEEGAEDSDEEGHTAVHQQEMSVVAASCSMGGSMGADQARGQRQLRRRSSTDGDSAATASPARHGGHRALPSSRKRAAAAPPPSKGRSGARKARKVSAADTTNISAAGDGSFECTASAPPRIACGHCGTRKTPQWRAGPAGRRTLCNACGVRFKSGRLVLAPKQANGGFKLVDSGLSGQAAKAAAAKAATAKAAAAAAAKPSAKPKARPKAKEPPTTPRGGATKARTGVRRAPAGTSRRLGRRRVA